VAEVGVEFRLLAPLAMLRPCSKRIHRETTDPAELHGEIRSSAFIENTVFSWTYRLFSEIAINCFTEIFIHF